MRAVSGVNLEIRNRAGKAMRILTAKEKMLPNTNRKRNARIGFFPGAIISNAAL